MHTNIISIREHYVCNEVVVYTNRWYRRVSRHVDSVNYTKYGIHAHCSTVYTVVRRVT